MNSMTHKMLVSVTIATRKAAEARALKDNLAPTRKFGVKTLKQWSPLNSGMEGESSQVSRKRGRTGNGRMAMLFGRERDMGR